MHAPYEQKTIIRARRKACKGLLRWSVLVSLSLHCLMFAAMIAPAMQQPAVATENVFFQVSSLFFLGGEDVPSVSSPWQQNTADSPPAAPPAADTMAAVSGSRKDAASSPAQTPAEAEDKISSPSDDRGERPEMVIPHSVVKAVKKSPFPPTKNMTAPQAALPASPLPSSTPASDKAPRKHEPDAAGTGRSPEAEQKNDRNALMKEEKMRKAAMETSRQAELERLAVERQKQSQLELEKKLNEQRARQAAEREKNVLEEELRKAENVLLSQDKARRQQVALEQAEKARKAREEALRKTEEEGKARELSEQKRLAQEKARRQQVAREQERDSKTRDEARRKIDQQNRDRTLQENNGLAAERSRSDQPAKVNNIREVKGIPVPTVRGDLKLVVSGTRNQPLTVTFKEFRKSRRDRPFTRAEARSGIPVFPVIVTTRADMREAVIEKAKEGIYTFSQEHCSNCDNSFSLILYEATAKKVKKIVRPHSVGGKDVVARILMPEGILWDDEASFTGSMEDTDSITKFESTSGLVWKEYTE